MSLEAGVQTAADQIYAVLASPPVAARAELRMVPSPAPSTPFESGSYSLEQFLSKPLNILALSLGVTGTVALLGLLVAYLIIQRSFARMQRRNRENLDQPKKGADLKDVAVENLDGLLVRHPDGSFCYGIHRLSPRAEPVLQLLDFRSGGTEAGQGSFVGCARPEGLDIV